MVKMELDSGRTVTMSLRRHSHLDYGYAVTSHSSQGLTADRVLVNVDTANSNEKLLNTRFAYIAISRARFESVIYTDNAQALSQELSREISKRTAIENRQEQQQDQARCQVPKQKQYQDLGLSLWLRYTSVQSLPEPQGLCTGCRKPDWTRFLELMRVPWWQPETRGTIPVKPQGVVRDGRHSAELRMPGARW